MVDRLDLVQAGQVERNLGECFAIQFISLTDLDFLQTVQHVELGDGDRFDTVEPDYVAQGHQVKPATTSRSTGGGAVLVALRTQSLARIIDQFSREGTCSNASSVGLDDPDYFIDSLGTDTQSGEGAADGGCLMTWQTGMYRDRHPKDFLAHPRTE